MVQNKKKAKANQALLSTDRTKMDQYISIVKFIQKVFKSNEKISLHESRFVGNEKKYLMECIDSTYVSSIGSFVNMVEKKIASIVGCRYAIAVTNGTSALHIALLAVGVKQGDEVITQPLTFVATCNAISYTGAKPIFVDVERKTLGMSPESLKSFLEQNCQMKDQVCINRTTGKVIKVCIPMHTFGHPCRIDEIKKICDSWNISVVEDSAESLGSFYKGKHTGTFGKLGVLSFNGNKIVTSGGGGCVVTDDEALALKIKHLTATAKMPHSWEYSHDTIGYNYRMPNLNAALLMAGLEQLDKYIENKRELANIYQRFFDKEGILFMMEPVNARSNY